MDANPFRSKTLAYGDLALPAIAPWTAELRRFALKLGATNLPFAVNGILKRRIWLRRHKMWEYARAVACVMGQKNARRGAAVRGASDAPAGEVKERRKFRVLDFGGGATLPVFFLAQRECEVWCLDVDSALVNWTNKAAWKRSWRLRALTHDLTQQSAPPDWGKFDAVISCSVLEHTAKPHQKLVFERLGGLLKPGGVLLFSFDYGKDAPAENAVRSEAEIRALVESSGLSFLAGDAFEDTGERFALDKRHSRRKFTFASLFLQKG
jgi:SAM-dependent methyltransferase